MSAVNLFLLSSEGPRPRSADDAARLVGMAARGALRRLLLPGLGCALLLFPQFVQAVVPSNDRCSAPISIPAAGPFPYFTPIVDITEATTTGDPPPPPCQASVTRGVWYRITPQVTAVYQFSTCDGATSTTESDTVMAIYEAPNGCNGTFTLLGCVDDNCRRQSELLAQMTANIRYYIVIWQYAPPEGPPPTAGTVQIRVDRFEPPPNENCLSAAPLTLGIPVEGSTLLAENDYELGDMSAFTGIGQEPVSGDHRDVAYSFVAPEAGEYSFRLSGYVGGDILLYLTDVCPLGGPPSVVTNSLGAANRSTASSSEEVLCVTLAAAQQVYVIVDEQLQPGRSQEGGAFRLQVSRCFTEVEGNDFPQTPNEFVCNISGSIAHEFDQDFFYIGSPPAGSRLFALVDGEASSMTDFDLRVTTTTDVLEYDNADNDVLFGNFAPNIAGTPLEGGASYLLVTFRGQPNFNGAEPYHLHSVLQPPLEFATAESEPNDAPIQANFTAHNYYYGNLFGPPPSADADYFEFQAEAGDLVFLSLDGDPLRNETPIDASLALLGASGEVLSAADNVNEVVSSSTNRTTFFFAADSPFSPGEGLVYRVDRTGTYYAEVRIGFRATDNVEGAGDYLLSISRNCVQGGSGQHGPPQFLSAGRLAGTGVRLRLEGSPFATYRIEGSVDFGIWTTLGYATADALGQFEFRDLSITAEGMRFYRALWP